ncbi:hypothetical protein GGX14DRAFT_391113 [Mycena pura]|uniref:Uncharacterized protein n=1 Tax=Mycena pura TaxID=153505 RepID=A0AAD6VML8_9AGAR|nr:hypothetical protein GGX14DRAFT_391113 [Mycena pura]
MHCCPVGLLTECYVLGLGALCNTMFDGLIDIFVDKQRGPRVLAYFACATELTPSQTSNTSSSSHPFISETFYFSLSASSNTKLAVHITNKESPRCTVFRFPLSTQFVHFDGRSIIVPYSSLSMSGLAIPNKAYLPLSNANEVRDLAEIERLANTNGVRLCILGTDHRVFARYYAPLSTSDNLSTTFTLRDSMWGLDDDLKVSRCATIWSLGPQVEPSDAEANFFVHCIRLNTEWDIDGARQLTSLFQDC